jgi:uncharacterized protein YbbC (DUF1343 family)/CubicO group peptidase (beta-lactamase class C family)
VVACTLLLPLFLVLDSAQTQSPAGKHSTAGKLVVLDKILQQAIDQHQIPGAVLLVSHDGVTVYRRAIGSRSLEPRREPMTVDTVFDLASLTKVVATTIAVMQLVEKGQLRDNDPVAKYIPEFAQNGKEDITIRELLTHHSGLPPDLDLSQSWQGRDEALRLAFSQRLINPPGSRFVYSDVGFTVLGALVERVSGMSLEEYCQQNILTPLAMNHTRFVPPRSWLPNIAPTEYDDDGKMLRGVVHDPTVRRMGGVGGQAGLFSTADDLAKFADFLLRGGPVLSPLMIQKMTTPQQPPTSQVLRGFGWDIDSPLSSNRGELLPVGSFGHTGFTGTSLWIDPTTKTYIILLTNAVHPRGGNAVALRTKVATAITAALPLSVTEKEALRWKSITGYNEAQTAARRIAVRNGAVRTGLDVLEAHNFAPLRGTSGQKKIALLTNQTGVDAEGRRTIDVLAQAPGISLTEIFSPEHGVAGNLDTTRISESKDAATGIPVYSVYGASDASRRPAPELLRNLDAIVIDLQDAGVRFYTYETTLGYFLEAAAKAGVEVVVLDRPNPLTGSFVQGPVSDAGEESFVNYFPIPIRHGMTIGELARFFNGERHINARLQVVGMEGWIRGDWYDSTALIWVNPSPNLRSLTEATLYPGAALVEGTNVSVGRGTDTPFEVLGAPWINSRELASYLNQREISGVRFVPISFTPNSSNYAAQKCDGVNIILTERNAFDAPELGVELASALHALYPEQFHMEKMKELLVNQSVYSAIASGEDPHRIAQAWQAAVNQFEQTRQKYLIYEQSL